MKEFFRRTRTTFARDTNDPPAIPDDIVTKCPECRELIYTRELNDNLKVCPKCGHHMRIGAREWLDVLNLTAFEEFDADLRPGDPLGFVSLRESYAEKLTETQERTGMADAVIAGMGLIDGMPLVVAVSDFSFMGASMGSVYGEKMARAAEHAAVRRVPLLTINSSGGARMHEGIIALMQMAKVSMALTRLAAVGQPHISLLVDPCYGGVTASYASVADVIIAESGANIGFAGKRVIEGTIRQKLPAGFQTAEFVVEHGMADMVASRGELRPLLAKLLRLYGQQQNGSPKTYTNGVEPGAPPAPARPANDGLTPWDRVQIARHMQRPRTLDYINGLCEDFVELRGDRRYGDDGAIVGGLARFGGQTVMVLGHQKGRDTRENVRRNFGMAHPEGYRKALRLFRHAEKFGLPLLCFIDTSGANPNKESEERGQANAIAECILAMADLRVPILACVIGEGGSGGALAIGVADRLLMLENSIYSVASPEGAASILWRDSAKAADAARAMRITAADLHELGIADEVVPEPEAGAHTDTLATVACLGQRLQAHLGELRAMSMVALLEGRYARYRAIGHYHEQAEQLVTRRAG
ncbi:MAG: acetyl-CoA carboxylase carboxyltransferase subunit alpha [Chloroflexaceae bacterium]|jgi:acetyl-CoA carboxylase carboxyl transferase subunit beta|nr:acetyl-CoA carboxylase carboxyltransferase subunit alpha [Chloroflexaceae bacterium]